MIDKTTVPLVGRNFLTLHRSRDNFDIYNSRQRTAEVLCVLLVMVSPFFWWKQELHFLHLHI